ncbi:hypothetical protein B0H17DRAFT_1191163 [Mycena rosella]|uniref:Uncharacterized protein n=1 Tax=Mycena rosella TaxID=1033263 RepID=A0AAD7MB12_MYCRO|nr:hypothetical protein B0H17DRAFT_1191163 [Mycena rosella]
MGGVNNGLGLDSSQSLKVNGMMNRDDPLALGETDFQEGEQLMAWFSDEEDDAT